MKKVLEFVLVFSLGAVLYGMIEVAFRGRTHWTMLLLGGVCFEAIYILNILLEKRNILVKCVFGAVIISILEFLCGYIVNIRLHMKIWDYSGLKFNLLGQICPKYFFLWFLLCIPAYVLCDIISKNATNKSMKK